jgi:2-iminobutanoate/2-iminopropanoate deaminase
MPHLSPAQRAGNLLFLSGQLALDENRQIKGDCAAQTTHCLERIRAVLRDNGADISSIVKVTVWMTDRENFLDYDRAYAEFFGDHRPARSTVISGLALEPALVEIEAVAWVE